MTQEEKQEEREYWTKLLADGPVWCEVSESITSTVEPRLVIAYVGGNYPFISVSALDSKDNAIAEYKSGKYNVKAWKHATPILPNPRRPWTAEEIMAHGVFELHGDIVTVVDGTEDFLIIGQTGRWDKANFIDTARAVCLELRDGILCDTGKRVELYKDGE